MIIGMATDKYGYDRNLEKQSATKAITAAIHRAGLPINPKTVRTHLDSGGELLDDVLP